VLVVRFTIGYDFLIGFVLSSGLNLDRVGGGAVAPIYPLTLTPLSRDDSSVVSLSYAGTQAELE